MDMDYDEVGALRLMRRLRGGGGGLASRAAARPVTQRRSIAATRQRQQMTPLGSVSVPAGGTANLEIRAEKALQADKLVLASTGGAGEVTIENIFIGTVPQVTNIDAMPVEAFSADSTAKVIFDPVSTGQRIRIELANSGAAAAVVSGVLFGVAAEV